MNVARDECERPCSRAIDVVCLSDESLAKLARQQAEAGDVGRISQRARVGEGLGMNEPCCGTKEAFDQRRSPRPLLSRCFSSTHLRRRPISARPRRLAHDEAIGSLVAVVFVIFPLREGPVVVVMR